MLKDGIETIRLNYDFDKKVKQGQNMEHNSMNRQVINPLN